MNVRRSDLRYSKSVQETTREVFLARLAKVPKKRDIEEGGSRMQWKAVQSMELVAFHERTPYILHLEGASFGVSGSS